MNTYRYILASNKAPKLNCPYCGAKKHWQRYINKQTGEMLPEFYGKCDNATKCGEENNPYKNGYAKQVWQQERSEEVSNWKGFKKLQKPTAKPMPQKAAFMPKNVLQQTLQGYEQNVFLQNLLSRVPFPIYSKDVEKVTAMYYLGTVSNGYRAGAITFPFIDKGGNVRAIQVKEFDEANHTTGTDFLHSIIEKHHQRKAEPLPEWLQAYNQNETKVSCCFGQHLIGKYALNPIALVKAPKTAVYGTLYFGFPEQPENLLWLAVYNLSSLNFEKCKALQGRDVYLFPDLSKDGKAFQLWSRKANELSERMPGTRFEVSSLLETLAPNELRESGADIADVLTGLDWKQVRGLWQQAKAKDSQPEYEKHEKYEPLKNNYFSAIDPTLETIYPAVQQKQIEPNNYYEKPAQPKAQSWELEITELENYFSGITLPKEPVKPNGYSTITNIPLFLETHFATIKANDGKRTFQPFLNRLHELKNLLNLK